MAEHKIPAVLSNFVLPEDLKGVFNVTCTCASSNLEVLEVLQALGQ